MGSKEQDFLLDLAIKRMTSSLRAENESKRAEHIEADCGLEQVASSVRMRLIFCTKKFPMSIANILTPPKFKLKLVGAGFVFSQLRKCKLWKSAKGLCSRRAISLTRLINMFLLTEWTPNYWEIAGKHDDRDNYRPISLLFVETKVLEKAVHTQLLNYLESNNLLSGNQYRFCKGPMKGTLTQLLGFIRINADLGYLIGAIFIDLREV